MIPLSRKHISDLPKNYIQIIILKDKISLQKYKKLTPYFLMKNSNLFMIGITSSMPNLWEMVVSQTMGRRKIIGMRNFTAKWEVMVLDTPNNQVSPSKGHKAIKISHNNLKSKLNGVRNYRRKLNWQEECSL